MSGHTDTVDKPNAVLAAAISAALAPSATAVAQDTPSAASERDTIEEIIVTARKREESLQRVPFSIQAIPEAQLKRMGATGMSDYARFIPSMAWTEESPGTSTIVFRGIRVEGGSGFLTNSSSAVYVDEFPVTSMDSQPDPHLVDIARVEALAGPQGTLFGASSQSGTLRIVTNQPDPSGYEAIADVSTYTGSESATSYEVSGVLNIPLVKDKFAVRLVGFSAEDAGFIDNVFGHTPDTYSGANIPFRPVTGIVAAESGTLDNAAVVEEDWNGVEYRGARVSALWNINDDWSATGTYLYQETEVGSGFNDYNPAVGDLQTIQWNKYVRDEEWDAFSLVIKGDLGFADLVSATSYSDRQYHTTLDRTVYLKHWSTLYCANSYPNYFGGVNYYFSDPATGTLISYPRYCWGPTAQSDLTMVHDGDDWEEKFSQEFRLSHEGENFSWLLGLYFEEGDDDKIRVWGKPASNDYQDSLSLVYWETGCGSYWGAAGTHAPGASYGDPRWITCGFGDGFAPNATAAWWDQDFTDWTEKAVFGEVTWRINDQWSAVVGGRAFERDTDKYYLVENPQGRLNSTGGISVGSGTVSDFVPKVSLTYQINDTKMVYGLITQGFRAGGVNRERGNIFFPLSYDADKLTNFELGAKTQWADGTFQANVTLFHMKWDDYQLEVPDPSFIRCGEVGAVDPCSQPWQTAVFNSGDAFTEGVEATFVWLPTQGLELGLNVMFLNAENDSDVDYNLSRPGIEIPKGARLPLSPESKGSAYANYSWAANFVDAEMFVRLQWAYTGDSLNQADTNNALWPQRTLQSYDIGDLRFGIVGGDWEVNLFIENLTDERAQIATANDFEHLFSNVADGVSSYHRIYTNRPREYGVRFMKRWGD